MKYETPEMQVIEVSANDVIKTSGITGGSGNSNVGGGGNIED